MNRLASCKGSSSSLISFVGLASGVNTPWQPCSDVLPCWHEYIIDIGCSAPPVRRRRLLFWRPRHRRQRAWPGSADLPYHLSRGRIPQLEKLTGYGRRNAVDSADFPVGFCRQDAVMGHTPARSGLGNGMAHRSGVKTPWQSDNGGFILMAGKKTNYAPFIHTCSWKCDLHRRRSRRPAARRHHRGSVGPLNRESRACHGEALAMTEV